MEKNVCWRQIGGVSRDLLREVAVSVLAEKFVLVHAK